MREVEDPFLPSFITMFYIVNFLTIIFLLFLNTQDYVLTTSINRLSNNDYLNSNIMFYLIIILLSFKLLLYFIKKNYKLFFGLYKPFLLTLDVLIKGISLFFLLGIGGILYKFFLLEFTNSNLDGFIKLGVYKNLYLMKIYTIAEKQSYIDLLLTFLNTSASEFKTPITLNEEQLNMLLNCSSLKEIKIKLTELFFQLEVKAITARLDEKQSEEKIAFLKWVFTNNFSCTLYLLAGVSVLSYCLYSYLYGDITGTSNELIKVVTENVSKTSGSTRDLSDVETFYKGLTCMGV